jgi:hypothetical protein
MKALSVSGARVLALSIVLVFMAVCSGETSDDERVALNQTITLYPAPRQHGSYSLYYDITLASPGLVSIGIEVLGAEPGAAATGNLLGVSLRRKSNEMELRHVDFGIEGGTFSYGIDAFELEKGRCEYRVVVSNWSLQQTVNARLVILYPGMEAAGKEEEKVILFPGGSI